jgi:multidrug efflux pump
VFFVVVRRFMPGSERQRKLHAHEYGPDLPRGATAGDQV